MKHFLRLLLLFPMLTGFDLRAQTFNANLAAMLQDSLDYYVNAIPNIKGMSAGVYLPGQGYWQGQSGDSYAGQPITADMEFGIASNTKLFVSATMLKLAEDGLLSLDDSVSAWLPAHPYIDPAISIRQLLNHTSGVSDPIFASPWM
ncbi:MAG TPA: serine hydrolase domain-containing protein, partial [Bacteroidia bacterium]|nr:serine hydrolase domain-containing protein [Bacteroidia bacterium]